MNDFREGLKYNPYENNKREITGKRTVRKNQKYRARRAMRNKIIALVLAGGLTIGAGTVIAKTVDSHEEKYLSNVEEMQKFNMNSRDLQISAESYEHVMDLSLAIKGMEEDDFRDISNSELADYYGEMEKLYLKLLKEKVSTVTGLKTSEFTLVAPTAHGSEVYGTQIKEPNMINGIKGISIKSNEIDDYMCDILELREIKAQILNDDVNRNKLEGKLVDYSEKLGEVATLNILKEMKNNDRTKLTTYRIATKDLHQITENEQVAEMEK